MTAWRAGWWSAGHGDQEADVSTRATPCPRCRGPVIAMHVLRYAQAVSASRARLVPWLEAEICDSEDCDFVRWRFAGYAAKSEKESRK